MDGTVGRRTNRATIKGSITGRCIERMAQVMEADMRLAPKTQIDAPRRRRDVKHYTEKRTRAATGSMS